MLKEKVLISACLLGKDCCYDGKTKLLKNINEYNQKYDLIPVCPEVDGGLSVPRARSWIEFGGKGVREGKARVVNEKGEDITEYLKTGARVALMAAIANNAKKPFSNPKAHPVELVLFTMIQTISLSRVMVSPPNC